MFVCVCVCVCASDSEREGVRKRCIGVNILTKMANLGPALEENEHLQKRFLRKTLKRRLDLTFDSTSFSQRN